MSIKDILFNNYENVYSNFPDGIIVLDFLRNIIVWNKKAEMIFGYTKSEVKNKNIMMLFGDDFEKFNRIIGLNHGSILKAITKSGENIFVDVTAYDAYNSARVIVSVRALSNKYLELEALLDDYQTTKRLVTNRDSFLSNLKLDILTPINAVIGFSQSLLDGFCGDLNSKQEKYVNIINNNSNKLKRIIDKVFEIISLDAESIEFHFKNFDFVKIIEQVIKNNSDFAKEKDIEIVLNINTQKRNAYSDEYALANVIQTTLENAIKYSSKGNVFINVIHPSTETLSLNDINAPAGYTEQSYLQIDVIDCGIGIDDEKSAGIFDEYSVKNLTVAQKQDGTALSLPIARKIIHKLNGRIWYTPNPDGGSVFSILIPIEKMSFE